VGDVLGAKLGGIFLLLEAGDLGETGEDFAGIAVLPIALFRKD
jgi:hypothetical protein